MFELSFRVDAARAMDISPTRIEIYDVRLAARRHHRRVQAGVSIGVAAVVEFAILPDTAGPVSSSANASMVVGQISSADAMDAFAAVVSNSTLTVLGGSDVLAIISFAESAQPVVEPSLELVSEPSAESEPDAESGPGSISAFAFYGFPWIWCLFVGGGYASLSCPCGRQYSDVKRSRWW